MKTHKSFVLNYNKEVESVRDRYEVLEEQQPSQAFCYNDNLKKENTTIVSYYDDEKPINVVYSKKQRSLEEELTNGYVKATNLEELTSAQEITFEDGEYSDTNSYFEEEHLHTQLEQEKPVLKEDNINKEEDYLFSKLKAIEEDEDFQDELKTLFEKGKKANNSNQESQSRGRESGNSQSQQDHNQDSEKKNPHAIFDKIAQSMQMAQTYDFGSIAMDKKFDDLEKETKNDFNEKVQDLLKKDDEGTSKVVEDIVKNSKEEKILTQDFLEDIDKLKKVSSSKSQLSQRKFSNDLILHPNNQGFIIDSQSIEIGDIILSTRAKEQMPTELRGVLDNDSCIAGLYLGENNIVFGEQTHQLQEILKDDINIVVLRHKNTNSTNNLRNNLSEISIASEQMQPYALVKDVALKISESYCDVLPLEEKKDCLNFNGKVGLETNTNDKFYCSKKVLDILSKYDLSITSNPVKNDNNNSIIQTVFNNSLVYVGHLKIK